MCTNCLLLQGMLYSKLMMVAQWDLNDGMVDVVTLQVDHVSTGQFKLIYRASMTLPQLPCLNYLVSITVPRLPCLN